jgi:hypothetical protein
MTSPKGIKITTSAGSPISFKADFIESIIPANIFSTKVFHFQWQAKQRQKI